MVSNTGNDIREPRVGRPKKRLGQHFLISTHYARRIAGAVEAPRDAAVAEIGAGKGALSVYLLQRFPSLHVVEMDNDLIAQLRDRLGPGQWSLHHENVLDYDLSSLGNPLHVVGNLPYNVAALIIRKVLLMGRRIASCTFMVQREVAERIVARPHTKQNGFLTIFCRFFGTARILFHVPPGAFFPKPRVDSSVIRIVPADRPRDMITEESWEDFFAFVDRGFSTRRKMLAKVLGGREKRDVFAGVLDSMGVGPSVRAEDLAVGQWVELYMKAGSA